MHTETEGHDTPNASKSIIKVHNGNISLAGEESSILQTGNKNFTDSDLNNSCEEIDAANRKKGLTFASKKSAGNERILKDLNGKGSTKKSKKGGNNFESNQMISDQGIGITVPICIFKLFAKFIYYIEIYRRI